MKLRYWFWLVILGFIRPVLLQGAGELIRSEWLVDGVPREGLLHVPARAAIQGVPVVFVFHGHGGSMRQAARSNPVHELWPEAIVVYLQGLPTPGRLTDRAGKENGWQSGPGEQGDRDLRLFDGVLGRLRHDYQVDAKRIYATGHSNGGSFTYLLWATRRQIFAAFGPSAAVAGRGWPKLQPAPVVHIAGERDELVKFSWQQRMLETLLRTNECDPSGQSGDRGGTLYSSKTGAPVLTYIHPGTHKFPAEATALIVDFFKTHAQR